MAWIALSLAIVVSTVGARQQSEEPMQLLDDYVHYALVAKPDLAAANIRALIDSGLSNAELALLLDEGNVDPDRYERAVARTIRVAELEALVAELDLRIESGRLDLMRDPKRIEQAVQMLNSHQRAKLIAEQRLEAAGEYAVPQLLLVITEGDDEGLKLRCADMIEKIGRQAVTPLTEALPNLGDPVAQRVVIDLLGDIGWSHAGPVLMEISLDESRGTPVRDAADRAYRNIGVPVADTTQLYSDLGMRYFAGDESLIAFPEESENNIWAYDPFVGLVKTPVPTEIYSQVMAMRQGSKSLDLDRANQVALALFVAANLKRANDLPTDKSDPIYGESRFSPEFYATVYGTQTCMDVLALAVDSVDTPLVRDAISSLAQTTGGANLFITGTGRQPLLETLSYPDRRVQYEGALTLGRALPATTFSGAFRVVPLLASAVRTGSRNFALAIVDNEEDRGEVVNALGQAGFEVIGFDASLSPLREEIARSVGVDLVVVWKRTPEGVRETITALNTLPKTSAAPILVMAPVVDAPELTREYRDDRRIKVTRPEFGELFDSAVEEVMMRASGGRITEAEAEIYAIEALAVLRDIALSNSPAYNISDAEPALLAALQTRTGGARLLVASILALIDSEMAQQALFDAALTAGPDEQIELLDQVGASVRKYGDRSAPRHTRALLELVETSSGETADAAARVHGALNLPSSDAVLLIP
jgi:hypothetical protein